MTSIEFERLLKPVLGQAYGYALRMLRGDEDLTADLIQDASISAFRGRHSFTTGTHFKAWFFKILINQYYRTGGKRVLETVAIDDTPEPYLYKMAIDRGFSEGYDPAEVVFNKLDQESVVAAIDELPDEFRPASLLYFMSEMSYEEISDALEIPLGTVRSRLHRGRKILQQSLWSLAESRGIVEEVRHV